MRSLNTKIIITYKYRKGCIYGIDAISMNYNIFNRITLNETNSLLHDPKDIMEKHIKEKSKLDICEVISIFFYTPNGDKK